MKHDDSYFFPKKDMMLPWLPLAAAGFLGLAADEAGVDDGVSFFAAGADSSSENDSQPASWIVTVEHLLVQERSTAKSACETYPCTPARPAFSSSS